MYTLLVSDDYYYSYGFKNKHGLKGLRHVSFKKFNANESKYNDCSRIILHITSVEQLTNLKNSHCTKTTVLYNDKFKDFIDLVPDLDNYTIYNDRSVWEEELIYNRKIISINIRMTWREILLLQFYCKGFSTNTISIIMRRNAKTISSMKYSLCKKLGINSGNRFNTFVSRLLC